MDPLDLLRQNAPALRAERITTIESGWDSVVYEVDEDWIFRFPRRAGVAERIRVEAALLPELAPTLPAPVPRFDVAVFGEVSFVGYRKLPGEPLVHGFDEPELGRRLGAFIAAVHRFPTARAVDLGVPSPEWLGELRAFVATLEERVVPLLYGPEVARARRLFDDFLGGGGDFDQVLLHADLGPEHVLHRGSELTGVLDWSDARIGDPALDLAWTLHGSGPAFADALLTAYGGDPALGERGRFYHRLGPWHEVLYGQDANRPELVRSGLEGIRERLP
jgi:aminoglycoside phosphotransferase (APT) family kinase protein